MLTRQRRHVETLIEESRTLRGVTPEEATRDRDAPAFLRPVDASLSMEKPCLGTDGPRLAGSDGQTGALAL